MILGSWAGKKSCVRILDIGTGSGIIALMLAQRMPDAEIHGIEIDEASFEIARKNFASSPFQKRITAIHGDISDYDPETGYDLIVCNPPFFSESLKPLNEVLTRSKHNISMGLEHILLLTSKHLLSGGELNLIIPIESTIELNRLLSSFGLFIHKKLIVFPNHVKPSHRIVAVIKKEITDHVAVEELIIENLNRHDYHQDYKNLCRDFYLHF